MKQQMTGMLLHMKESGAPENFQEDDLAQTNQVKGPQKDDAFHESSDEADEGRIR
jgi:hypothetical protein